MFWNNDENTFSSALELNNHTFSEMCFRKLNIVEPTLAMND